MDWRSRDFEEHPTYWQYYGPFGVSIHRNQAMCDIVQNGDASIKALPAQIMLDVDYTLPSKYGVGVITYKNNGSYVDEDFCIFIPAEITYGWGSQSIGATEDRAANKNSNREYIEPLPSKKGYITILVKATHNVPLSPRR